MEGGERVQTHPFLLSPWSPSGEREGGKERRAEEREETRRDVRRDEKGMGQKRKEEKRD